MTMIGDVPERSVFEPDSTFARELADHLSKQGEAEVIEKKSEETALAEEDLLLKEMERLRSVAAGRRNTFVRDAARDFVSASIRSGDVLSTTETAVARRQQIVNAVVQWAESLDDRLAQREQERENVDHVTPVYSEE